MYCVLNLYYSMYSVHHLYIKMYNVPQLYINMYSVHIIFNSLKDNYTTKKMMPLSFICSMAAFESGRT